MVACARNSGNVEFSNESLVTRSCCDLTREMFCVKRVRDGEHPFCMAQDARTFFSSQVPSCSLADLKRQLRWDESKDGQDSTMLLGEE